MPTKWDIRARAAEKVTVGAGGNINGTSWGQIAHYQKEFQKEYCPKCLHFNPTENCFCEQAYPHVPDLINCLHHRTDMAGQCWGFEERNSRRPSPVIKKEKSPIIVLPTDPNKIKELKKGLSTWGEFLNRYQHGPSFKDDLLEDPTRLLVWAFFQNAILERLFQSKQIISWAFFEETRCFLKEEGIDPLPPRLIRTFNDVCGVIERICNK